MPLRPRTVLAVVAVALAAAAARGLAFLPTELYADEAYYWLWSLRPAAGYFDHPPMVAWLIAASARFLGGELGVRLPFLVAGALTVLFTALLAAELARDGGEEPDAPALRGALLAATAPMLHLAGGLALPDGPLLAAFTAGLWLLARARGRRWLWAGLAVGLALLSKYTAALLAFSLLLAVPWDAALRRELRTRWPWLGAAVAVAVFAPTLAWDAARGWLSIGFQLGHGFGGGATPRTMLEFVVGQVAGAGPVALGLGVAALAASLRPGRPTQRGASPRSEAAAEYPSPQHSPRVAGRGGHPPAQADTEPRSTGARAGARWKPPGPSALRRVALAALLPLAVTTWAALRGKVEANWPVQAYPALCAAAALALSRCSRTWARALTGTAVALGVALLATFTALQLLPGPAGGTPAVERFHGWRQAARDVRQLTGEACPRLGCDAGQPFLVTTTYQLAGQLAFYGGYRRFGLATDRPSQLDLWDERPAAAEPFFFVGSAGPTPALARLFPGEGEQPTLRLPATPRVELRGRPGERWRPLTVTPYLQLAPAAATAGRAWNVPPGPPLRWRARGGGG